MSRAQPEQPQGQPYQPTAGDDQQLGYPRDAGTPAYGPAGSPAPAMGDPGTAPISTTDAGTMAGPATGVSRPRHSRTGAAWVAVVIAAIVLIFFLIFILQNSEPVQVQYLGWQGTLSLGVAMMFAALAGALTVGLLGTVRIMQLRTRAKRAGG
jgi:uncharacterized integral membrane protein